MKCLRCGSHQVEVAFENPPQTSQEFEQQLFGDPKAYAYFKLGQAVERDSKMSLEERQLRKMEQLYAAFKAGLLTVNGSLVEEKLKSDPNGY